MDRALQISKLDAAKRQLETVIRLYFHEGDPVSIHTLVAAAYQVVHDVNEKRGGTKMLVKGVLFDHVKPEMRGEFRKVLNEAENFFKHADRDHDATLDFNPDVSEVLIWDACSKYWELTGEQPPLFQIYRSWYMGMHSNLFELPEDMKKKLATGAAIVKEGRLAYFKLMLPIVMGSGLA